MDKAEFNFEDFTFDVNINNNMTVYNCQRLSPSQLSSVGVGRRRQYSRYSVVGNYRNYNFTIKPIG